MFLRIKNRVEKELTAYSRSIDRLYSLNKLSPILFKSIKEFICRDGKRVRPILFCIGYQGFSSKTPSELYRSALSLELLHDFMLVHDDIIDNSDTRRGKPSLHILLDRYLQKQKTAKFDGQDLAIVTGDVLYAMALDAFLAVKENPLRKEAAFKKLISAALYTGSGEFIELLLGIKPLEKVTQKDIYKIYDYKTANYTFASPLSMGAVLGGAKPRQVDKLFSYGIMLGRAFQIQDDIIGAFSEEKESGKSSFADIKEAKRTLLVWYAFKKSDKNGRRMIKEIMLARSFNKNHLYKMREIIKNTGALTYAQNQIEYLFLQAENEIAQLQMRQPYKQALSSFSRQILKL